MSKTTPETNESSGNVILTLDMTQSTDTSSPNIIDDFGSALFTGSDDPLYFRYKNFDIYTSYLPRLNSNQWYNDEIINVGSNVMNKFMSNVKLFNTYFFESHVSND